MPAPAATCSSISSTLSLVDPHRGVEPGPGGLTDSHGHQVGDPGKAAAAILRALDARPAPPRLVLGTDATDAIAQYMDDARAEFLAWEAVSRSTDGDGNPEWVRAAWPGSSASPPC